ncbi:MAG: DMT family transporter [Calditrichaeota bacterium]|nr:MAG: DMT family transporter [Calditrichota bacterium]
MKQKTKTYLADFGLLYAAAIWGSTFFIVKESLDSIDPVVMVGYRFSIAALVLAIFLKFKKKALFTNFKEGLILGFLLWSLYIPQTIGLGYTSASNSGFITGLFIVFVPLFTFLFQKKLPSFLKNVAILLSLIGLWFLTGGLKDANFGDLITLITAVFYAAHLFTADLFVKKEIDPIVLSFQQFFWVGIFSFITSLAFDLPFEILTTKVVWIVLFLAFLPTLMAFVIQLVAQKFTSPIKVSLIFALEPVFAAIFAWTLGGETFVLQNAFGGLLIFIGMILSEIPSEKIRINSKK